MLPTNVATIAPKISERISDPGKLSEGQVVQVQRVGFGEDKLLAALRQPVFEGAVRFGAPYDIIGSYAPAILRRFSKTFPSIRVTLICHGDVHTKGPLPVSLNGASPRFRAPITLVAMPEECQSIPMTAPKDWNQNGCDRRRKKFIAAVVMHARQALAILSGQLKLTRMRTITNGLGLPC